MPSRSEKLIATRTPEEIRERVAELSRFGKKGGKRSLETMTGAARVERAKKASLAAAKKRTAARLAREESRGRA